MKHSTMTTAILLASLSLPAWAQGDSKAQPGQGEGWVWVQQPEQVRDQAPAEMIEAAFLGVNAEPLDFDTAKRLGVPRGTGLMIIYVADESPAAAAGLKKGDVLTKLDDQLLVNPEQFAMLVRMRQAGDKVALQVTREGQAMKMNANLVNRELPDLGPGGSKLTQAWRVEEHNPFGFDGSVLPEPGPGGIQGQVKPRRGQELPAEVRQMIKQMQQQMKTVEQQRIDVERSLQQMRQQLALNIEDLQGQLADQPGHATAMARDDEHEIKLVSKDGSCHLTIQDNTGKILFDGPMPENGKVDGLSDDVQNKVESLHSATTHIQAHKPEGDAGENEDPVISKMDDLPEGQWGFTYDVYNDRSLLLKLQWDGQKQSMKVYGFGVGPWLLATVGDFRVDPKWQKGEVEKLHVAEFDRLSEAEQDAIYEMLNDEKVKPLLIPASE